MDWTNGIDRYEALANNINSDYIDKGTDRQRKALTDNDYANGLERLTLTNTREIVIIVYNIILLHVYII